MEPKAKYTAVFTYDPEYGGYVAEVRELPGCVSQGKTMKEAQANIKEAIEAYLAAQADDRDEGGPPR